MTYQRCRSSVLVVALLVLASCAHPPPTLTPAGAAAFQATRAIKALDLLRDFAISANEQTPPLVSTETTRRIVTYHKSAITVIHTAPNLDWKATVLTGLVEVGGNLPAAEVQRLAPYVALVTSLLQELR